MSSWIEFVLIIFFSFLLMKTHTAMETGRTGRVQVEDIVFLVRKDPRKFARVKDLLTMNEELKKARKAFDEVKYAGVSWTSYLSGEYVYFIICVSCIIEQPTLMK